jgi:pimeloyl-ACP methyl ester carboxylesterase
VTARRVLSVVFDLLAVGALAYLAVCALLYFTQEGSIFYPGPNDSRLRRVYEQNRVEFASGEATIEGWWIENPHIANDLVILYFGGNAEDVLYTASTAWKLNARRMLVTNYRGYGASSGKPGQKALYQDGLATYEHALSRGARADRIVVMGRSLGSGVASMLAGQRNVGAAILVTPFDDFIAVASHHYPYLPVRMLLRHPFPSTEWARRARSPALVLAAERDTIIPVPHAQRLAKAWAGDVAAHVMADAGHNDIEQNPDYYRLINDFLTQVHTR